MYEHILFMELNGLNYSVYLRGHTEIWTVTLTKGT